MTATAIDNNTLSLWQLKKGQSCVLLDFDEALDPRYKARVIELGFRPKTHILCVKAPGLGAPKVYQINNSVFSLENSIAAYINVVLD